MSNIVVSVSDAYRHLSPIERRDEARSLILSAPGTDKLWYLVNGRFVRNEIVDGINQYSIIDMVNVFTDTKNDPRRYWNDKKKALIGSNTELSEKIGQLKMLAPDGKRRFTDVAPLWVLLGILSRLDTPASNDLTNAIFKGFAGGIENAALRYRASNIEHGIEWAAERNHKRMVDIGAFSDPALLLPDRWDSITGGN